MKSFLKAGCILVFGFSRAIDLPSSTAGDLETCRSNGTAAGEAKGVQFDEGGVAGHGVSYALAAECFRLDSQQHILIQQLDFDRVIVGHIDRQRYDSRRL